MNETAQQKVPQDYKKTQQLIAYLMPGLRVMLLRAANLGTVISSSAPSSPLFWCYKFQMMANALHELLAALEADMNAHLSAVLYHLHLSAGDEKSQPDVHCASTDELPVISGSCTSTDWASPTCRSDKSQPLG